MVEEPDIALIRRMWEAYEEGGLLAALDFASPDATWIPYSAEGRVFESTDEYRRHVEGMPEREEVVEARLGDISREGNYVVVSGRLRIRRPGSLRDTTMHWVHRVEDGKITYTASYPSRERALAAAGATA